MKALAELLKLITKLYGKKAMSKTLGTRTNVITLPDKETKRFLTNELNIDAASDNAIQKAYQDVEKLIPDIPKMNDQEILTLTGNLRRLDNRLNPPSAEVISIGTKQPVSPTGIKQLVEEAGQKSPPGTLMGDLESRLNQLRASGKKLEDIAKGTEPSGMSFSIPEKGIFKQPTTADELFDMITKNPYRSGGPLDPSSGIVRTAARQILRKKLDAGEIDIPDARERDAIAKSYQGGVDPIEVFRKRFGEDALQDLDEIADQLNRAGDYKEIDDILKKNKLFDIKPKKTYNYDEGVYSDEEMMNLLKKSEDDPDKFAVGGRVGFQKGTSAIFDQLEQNVSYPKAHKDGVLALSYPRVEYAYGSGLKLLKLLKKKGTDLKKAIKEAVDDLIPTGDPKLDADMAVDNMLETYNLDRNAIDQKDILDAYGLAYDEIKQPLLQGLKNKPKPLPDDFDGNTASLIEELKSVGLSKNAERLELMEKYPGIDSKLVDKILIDDNPQRKAEVLATLDEAFTMMKKGMSDSEILNTIKKTPRTKQASGGVAYLMGL